MISLFAQIRLLCWKNLKIQFRRRIGTVIEILLPILAFAVLLGLKSLLKNDSYGVFYPYETNASISSLTFNVTNYPTIYYYPSGTDTDALMGNLSASLDNVTVTALSSEEAVNDIGVGNKNVIGVIFNTADGNLNESLTYTLRFPTDAQCDNCTNSKKDDKQWDNKNVFDDSLLTNGPIFYEVENNPYVGTGFSRVQYEISYAYLMQKEPTADFSNIDSIMSVMPYTSYTQNNFAVIGIQFALPLFFMLSYLYTFLIAVKEIVLEKELRLKETMKMMGLSNFANWMGWFVKQSIFMVPTAVIIVVMCYAGKIFYTTSVILFVVFYLLYILTFILFSFFLSTIFSNSKTGASVAGVIFFVTYVPFFFIQRNYTDTHKGLKTLLCFLPNTCMAQGLTIISQFEASGFTLNFGNVNQLPSPQDNFTMAQVLAQLVLDCIILVLLTWYIEAVFPGKYGVGHPFYFFLTKNYWFPNSAKKKSPKTNPKKSDSKKIEVVGQEALEQPNSATAPTNTTTSSGYFEPNPVDEKAGVEINNLRKVYDNGKVAVENLSLNMYEGQITCLLGHNGAGKTTTMSMLTGLYEPTSGSAIINDYDITTNMDKCRESLGLCPQVNTLFSALTVGEHLEFFGTLKGIKKKELKSHGKQVLRELEMLEKKNNFPSGLSGGMKRKLCVGIAFLGGSKVVFLDEPTSGMDPSARRKTWEVILNNREGRTICLTTHFLDEADLLGNRIAIMADGKLMTCGSSLFLKKHYGVGYQLIAAKREKCDTNKLTKVITDIIPGAVVLNNVGKEISFQLPAEFVTSFPALFEELDASLGELGLTSYGVSCTTLEEVFLKVGEHGDATEEVQDDRLIKNMQEMEASSIPIAESIPQFRGSEVTMTKKEVKSNLNAAAGLEMEAVECGKTHQVPKVTGRWMFFWMRFKALFIKRLINSKKDWKTGFAQLALPILFTALALILAATNNALGDSDNEPPLLLEPSIYQASTNIALDNHYANYVTGTSATTASGLQTQWESQNFTNVTTGQSMSEYILSQQANDIFNFRYSQVAAISMTDETSTLINSTLYLAGASKHSYGVFLNTYMEGLLNSVSSGATYSITPTNYPYQVQIEEAITDSVLGDSTGYLMAFLMLLGISFLTSSFVIFLVNERKSGAKHIQFVSGVQPKLYWLTNYCWDFVNYLVPIFVILILFAAFQQHAYVDDNRLGIVFLLLVLYFFATMPLIYLSSFIFDVPATAFSVTAVINILIGLFTLLIVDLFRNIAGTDDGDAYLFGTSMALVRVFYIFPNFSFAVGIMDMYKNWQLVQACYQIIIQTIKVNPNSTQFPHGTATCSNQQYLDDLANTGYYILDKDYQLQINYLSTTPPGVGGSVIALILEGFVFLGLLFLIEYKFKSFGSDGKADKVAKDVDVDVAVETERVQTMNSYDYPVIIKGLAKIYPKKGKQAAKRAVDGLDLSIDKGECFGLLGVNGAGKTTTFKMLTGDYLPTEGDAFISGHSVVSELQEVRRNVGYCPQFDALNPRLTGRETLRMYARLRGIVEHQIENEVQRMIEKLDLTKHSERNCGTYSGGNKRKLSTAMALIGDPEVILLDEPTSGVDPTTRRFLWDVLSQIVKEGKVVVLTSHSMDECEALCTRLTIMVDGSFKCLGSVQHLKSRFGNGYSMSVKKKYGLPTDSLKARIAQVFPAAKLLEEHSGLLNYKLPIDCASLGFIFTELEDLKLTEDVEDYGFSQTSLEQIFLKFSGEDDDLFGSDSSSTNSNENETALVASAADMI